MPTPYLSKYLCSDCSTAQWAISNPLQCQRCGGIMIDDTGLSRYTEFDWDSFDKEWGEMNAE